MVTPFPLHRFVLPPPPVTHARYCAPRISRCIPLPGMTPPARRTALPARHAGIVSLHLRRNEHRLYARRAADAARAAVPRMDATRTARTRARWTHCISYQRSPIREPLLPARLAHFLNGNAALRGTRRAFMPRCAAPCMPAYRCYHAAALPLLNLGTWYGVLRICRAAAALRLPPAFCTTLRLPRGCAVPPPLRESFALLLPFYRRLLFCTHNLTPRTAATCACYLLHTPHYPTHLRAALPLRTATPPPHLHLRYSYAGHAFCLPACPVDALLFCHTADLARLPASRTFPTLHTAAPLTFTHCASVPLFCAIYMMTTGPVSHVSCPLLHTHCNHGLCPSLLTFIRMYMCLLLCTFSFSCSNSIVPA